MSISHSRIHLWDHTPGRIDGPDTDADPTDPTMDIYLPPREKARGAGVVVLPGGGYQMLATDHEGRQIAEFFNAHHIAAFIVRYRHAPRYHHPIPLMDAQRALRIVRANAADYHVDPRRIGIMGFSAGGHLASTVATQFTHPAQPPVPDAIDSVSPRPDFTILLYPVISFVDEAAVHVGSRTHLTGGDESLWPSLSSETRVTGETPPTFLVHASADKAVPAEHSIHFYLACRKANVPAELHIFQEGGHGFGLGAKDSAAAAWPAMLLKWMEINRYVPPSTV